MEVNINHENVILPPAELTPEQQAIYASWKRPANVLITGPRCKDVRQMMQRLTAELGSKQPYIESNSIIDDITFEKAEVNDEVIDYVGRCNYKIGDAGPDIILFAIDCRHPFPAAYAESLQLLADALNDDIELAIVADMATSRTIGQYREGVHRSLHDNLRGPNKYLPIFMVNTVICANVPTDDNTISVAKATSDFDGLADELALMARHKVGVIMRATIGRSARCAHAIDWQVAAEHIKTLAEIDGGGGNADYRADYAVKKTRRGAVTTGVMADFAKKLMALNGMPKINVCRTAATSRQTFVAYHNNSGTFMDAVMSLPTAARALFAAELVYKSYHNPHEYVFIVLHADALPLRAFLRLMDKMQEAQSYYYRYVNRFDKYLSAETCQYIKEPIVIPYGPNGDIRQMTLPRYPSQAVYLLDNTRFGLIVRCAWMPLNMLQDSAQDISRLLREHGVDVSVDRLLDKFDHLTGRAKRRVHFWWLRPNEAVDRNRYGQTVGYPRAVTQLLASLCPA